MSNLDYYISDFAHFSFFARFLPNFAKMRKSLYKLKFSGYNKRVDIQTIFHGEVGTMETPRPALVRANTSKRCGMSITDDIFTSAKKFGDFRVHSRPQISLIVSGEGYWNIGSTRYHVREGDMFVLSPVDLRQFEQLPTGKTLIVRSLRYLGVHDHLVDMNVFYLRPPGFTNLLPKDNPHFEHILSLYQQICDCIRSETKNPLDDSFVAAALALMNIHLRYIYETCLPKVGHNQNKLLIDTCRYIVDHITEDLSAEVIAGALYCSPSHLSRTFHRLGGICLTDYIRRVRVTRVIATLRNSDDNVLDAAFACGFRSASGFYKAFRAETGMSPGEYLEM